MGLHDRDYERSWDTGSGWRDGGNYGDGGQGIALPRSANNRLLIVLAVIFLLQLIIDPGTAGGFTDFLSLPSDWFVRPWRAFGLVSYGLVHGDTLHLFFNGLALFFFGRSIEDRFGGREYLCFLFSAVVVGGVVWSVGELVAAAIADTPPTEPRMLLGISAGICAVVVAFGLLNPNAKVLLFLTIPVPAILIAVMVVYFDIVGAFSRSGNVAYIAHLGGAAFGYLYLRQITGRGMRLSQMPPYQFLMGMGGIDWKKALQPKPKLKIHRDEEPEANDAAAQRMDELLRKIQAGGMESLTREERRFMERTSRELKKRRQ